MALQEPPDVDPGFTKYSKTRETSEMNTKTGRSEKDILKSTSLSLI